ncbi:MAG: T9SS type A sorting domain-containing protein [Bacteroidota bacterium]
MKVFVKIFRSGLLACINMAVLSSYGQTNTFRVLTDLGTHYDYAYSIDLQSDGKVIVAGDAYGTPCMVRFDTTGVLDHSFGLGGKVFASWDCGSNPADNDIKIQSDGKIVLGTSCHNGENTDFIVARYNIDGSPDLEFGENGQVISQFGSFDELCNTIAIQPDGKILAAGGIGVLPAGYSEYDFALARYHSDGTIDDSFGNYGFVSTHFMSRSSIAYDMAIQQDGKIVLAGEARDTLFTDFALARYHSDGSPDFSFGTEGVVRTALSETYDHARAVVLQADEKILVAGSAQNGLYNENIALVRYDTTGLLDGTFGTDGVVITDIGLEYGHSIALQPDQKIILAGEYRNTKWDFAALRYNVDGSLDQSFGVNGMISTSFGNGESSGMAVAIGNDGEIFVAGTYNHGSPDYMDFALARLFSNLVPDYTLLLASPGDGDTVHLINPTLAWNPVLGASSYNLQVSTSLDFGTTAIYESGIPNTNFPECVLNNNTTYYWRVSANIDEITGEWSEPWHFTTGVTIGIDEGNNEHVGLYPVPIADHVFIDGIEEEHTTVTVLTMDGKLLRQTEGFGIREIDLHDFPDGMYVLSILNSKMRLTKKIIKQ